MYVYGMLGGGDDYAGTHDEFYSASRIFWRKLEAPDFQISFLMMLQTTVMTGLGYFSSLKPVTTKS